MFFNFFKRSKTRNSSKNEKECANEKQTLPDSGNVDSARKKFSFPKGTHTNNQNCGSTDKHLALSQLEKTNHCANSLVGALHLNQIPVPTSSCSSSYSESIDDDTTKNKNINREIHYDKIPSVSPQQEKKQQYLNDNYLDRKQNDLTSNVVEVNVYKKNNNNNSSKGDRQKNDSNSKISTNADSYDATTLDGARLNEPVSKFSPKLFAFREKRGDKSQNNSSGTSFFNDLIMGKGRQRNRHQQKPQAQQQQQKNKQSQVQAHGSGVNGPKKNNNNVKNLPQNTPTNIEKCNKNQGDTKINVSKRENLPQEQQNNNQRGVVKNNIVHENDVNHGCVSECSPNDVNTTTLKENSDQETSHNDENASPFIHLPSNEQQGAATKLNLSRENSNEFTPPEKKTKLSETVNGELCEENIVAIENLRENHQENCGEKQTDEMGQPNSKNGVNNNESNANYNSTTSDVTIETVSNNNNNSNHIQENLNQDEMGTDETIGGVQEQREISPSGSNITKTVRFNDENLCSYADDIFYEANDNSNLQSYISLENLSQLPNDELNNSNSDRDISDNNKNNKVPLVQCEDDEFDLINDNDDDDDDEIPSTYEEAQSISILVKDDEFCENIVQPPTNNLTKENHENEINEKNNFNSAFNDDHDHDKNNEENLIKITQKNNETSIYAINSLENTENQLSNDENQIKIETEEKNCENIHSFENTSDESEENSLNTNLNNNKNLYMEDTISLPDIIESSHHTGINGLGDELKIDEKPDKIAHEMRDLVNQESRYNVQLEAAEEKALAAQQKVNELKAQIYNLEREISNKGGVQERLQAELEAANKDSEQVRNKLKQQAEELDKLKFESDNQTEEWKKKYYDLEKLHMETEDKLKSTQTLATSLQIQIADVRSDTEKCQLQKEKLMDEKMEEQKVLREALDKALKERNEIEAKWKHDFEQLRNVNSDREERLMEDCEWKMRSMQKQCKEKLDNAEKEKAEAVAKMLKIEEDCKRHTIELANIKSYEHELNQLRNLTNGQHETIAQYRQQIDDLKAELAGVTKKLEDEIYNCQEIKKRFELQLIEKEKEAINRIDIARGTIAMQWEDKLLDEMARLKMELEQIGLEEKQEALAKLRKETDEELTALTSTFTAKQEELEQEITSLKQMLEDKQKEYEELQAKSDTQMMETRLYLDRAERENQAILDKEIRKRESIIETMKKDHTQEVAQMEQKFNTRIERLQEEYQRDLSDQTELLKSRHKRELEDQWKQLVAEKEEALQSIESRHKKKIEEAENHIRELITSHENALKELQEAHTSERSALEKRDSKNVQEIDTLHKKCRCLTKLFEEMRMRYERRDPRPEDLRQITELKSIVEAQDRDLRILTERFREIQIYQQHQQNMMHSHSLPPYAQVVAQQQQAQAQQQMPSQQGQSPQQQSQMIPPMRTKSKSRTPQKQLPNGTPLPPPPPPPPISTAMMQMFNATQNHMSPICEVIYEENEDNEQMNGHQNGNKERTPARMNGDTHIPPPVDQKAIVNDIINEVVASAHIQAHGLAESAF